MNKLKWDKFKLKSPCCNASVIKGSRVRDRFYCMKCRKSIAWSKMILPDGITRALIEKIARSINLENK